jgi:5'-nucleotidase
MRILLTNDDGIDQPGLLALESGLSSHELWTVAPSEHCSGMGQSLGLHSRITVRRMGPRRWAVDGSPTDCVKLALWQLMPPGGPDLLVSGINPGPNMANNVYYSGTVAAATEASFWGVPAFAVSQDFARDPHFAASAEVVRRLVDSGIHRMLPEGTILNVNIPLFREGEKPGGFAWTRMARFREDIPFESDASGTCFTYRGVTPQPVHTSEGTDVEALSAGRISLTLLRSDRSLEPPPGVTSLLGE